MNSERSFDLHARMIIILLLTHIFSLKQKLPLIKDLDLLEAVSFWKVANMALFLYRAQLSCKYWLSYGNWNSTGLKILAARWVDLGYCLWRACLHSLADVITSYQRGISVSCNDSPLESTGLHEHHLAVDWQGAWPRSSTEKSHICISCDWIKDSW